MKKITIFILFFLAVCTASAQIADRLTDKDIRALIETIEQDRDRFEELLEDKMKNAWYRSPKGEMKIALVLDDLRKNVKAMKESFTKDYSASNEAANTFRHATIIDSFIKEHPDTKAATEWEHFSVNLRTLAYAYGTDFPLPADATVRRINDLETAMAADALIRTAKQFKKEVERNNTVPEEMKEAYKRDTEELIKQAITVRARTWDSKAANMEAKAIMDLAMQIGQSLQRDQISSSITSAWNSMQASLQKLSSAYGMTVRGS